MAATVAVWAASPVGTPPLDDWKIAGPFGGTATAIAIDPEKPTVLLAGGMNSLLYRSEDSGATWELLAFPKRHLAEVTSVMVDPVNSNHYFAGMISAENGGLFASDDAGETWYTVKDMSGFGIRALTASMSRPSRFVAGTLRGVWLSDDSGKSWKRISDESNLEMSGISAVAIDPKDPDTIYAGTSHLPWKTIDGGKTWESIHTGMIDDSDVFSLYVNPGNPAEVLASACSGIYLSGTHADQWRKLMGIPNSSRRTHVVREDPTNPNIIFAGTTTGLFKSNNKGTTWRTVTNTQVNSLVFDPSHPSTMYLALANDGIGKSYDSGEAIALTNHGFTDRSIDAVGRSGNRLVAVESSVGDGSGVFVSADAGESWSQMRNTHGIEYAHLKSIAGFTSEDRILLAASARQMYKSIDGGLIWKPLPVRLLLKPEAPPAAETDTKKAPVRIRGKIANSRTKKPIKPVEKFVELKPSEITALYTIKSPTKEFNFAATDLGLLRSDDMGEHWTQMEMMGLPAASALYYSPNLDGRLIARTATGLFATKDYGDHWAEMPFPLPVADIYSVAIPPDPNCPLLVGTRTGLYSSADDGGKWSENPKGMPISTVNAVLYTGKDQTAYALGYGQLYETTDAGAAWTPLPSSSRGSHIRQLWVPDSSSGRLYGIASDLGILFRN